MIHTHELFIEGHKLTALSFNPDAQGTPIILLHGVTASVGMWVNDEISLFTKHGPVYALSLPGHYPAVFPPHFQQKELTAKMIARVLTTAIRTLIGERPVTLVGHSTGGFAAIAIAAHTPAIAHSVICISGFVQGRWIGPLGIAQRIVQHGRIGKAVFKLTYIINGRSRAWFKTTWQLSAVNPKDLRTFPSLDTVIDNSFAYHKHLDPDAMAQYFIVMPAIDIETWLPRITAPTLVLVGDSDPIVPSEQSSIIAAHVPHAQLNVFKNTGHTPLFERYDEYQQIVTAWLQEKSSP